MRPDIEKYLNNEMSPDERTEFEMKLQVDPALRTQVEESRALLDRLKTQYLREKITAALQGDQDNDSPVRKNGRNGLWLILVLVGVVASVVWFIGDKDIREQEMGQPEETIEEKAPPPEKVEKQEEQPAAPKEDVRSPSNQQPKAPPIASNPGKVPSPREERIRGEESDPDEWNRLVNAVWITRFEPEPGTYNDRFAPVVAKLKDQNFTEAFVQLYTLERQNPNNDTLVWLKGYCLLEMREGGEALRCFDKIKAPAEWQPQLDWYRMLAFLLIRDKPKTLELAGEIARSSQHPFYPEATKLLKDLQK